MLNIANRYAQHWIQSRSDGAFLTGNRRPFSNQIDRPPALIEFKKRNRAHGRIRTAGLLLTKEVQIAQFPNGALLRSNAGALCNNRCLAALPRNSTHQPWKTP